MDDRGHQPGPPRRESGYSQQYPSGHGSRPPSGQSTRPSAGQSSRPPSNQSHRSGYSNVPTSASQAQVPGELPRRKSRFHEDIQANTPVVAQAVFGDARDKKATSGTVDRRRSLMGLDMLAELDIDDEAKISAEPVVYHYNVITQCAAHVAELEMRKGLRTLHTAQATTRLEERRAEIAMRGWANNARLNAMLQNELFSLSERLRELVETERKCKSDKSMCECQLPGFSEVGGPRYTVVDHLSGYHIDEYIRRCDLELPGQSESVIVWRIYKGLDDFFIRQIGAYKPEKKRCQTIHAFQEAWVLLMHEQQFLNQLDRELMKMVDEGRVLQKNKQHHGVKGFWKRLRSTGAGLMDLVEGQPGSSEPKRTGSFQSSRSGRSYK